MDAVLGINLQLHIVAGVIALAAFWGQMLSRKGSAFHVANGRIFVISGLLVAGAALLSLILNIADAFSRGYDLRTDPDSLLQPALLGFISVLVVIALWSGRTLAQRHDDDADLPLVGVSVRFLVSGTATALVATYALAYRPDLWVAVLAAAALGANFTRDQFKLLTRRGADPTLRIQEHLSNMISAGLAFHAAFLLIGLDRFVNIWDAGAALPISAVAGLIGGGILADHLFRRRVARSAVAGS